MSDTTETKSGYNANSKENVDPNTHPGKGRDVAATGTGRQERDAKGHRVTSPRGAGSGENAIVEREKIPPREPVPAKVETTEYEEGDIDKGRIDFDAQANGILADVIPMRDRRAYLIDQGEKNEAANDELNARQVEQNRQVQFVQSNLNDPDVMRESSMESAIADLDMHDPERAPEAIEEKRRFRAELWGENTGEGVQADKKKTA